MSTTRRPEPSFPDCLVGKLVLVQRREVEFQARLPDCALTRIQLSNSLQRIAIAMTFSNHDWYERLRFSADEVVTRVRRQLVSADATKRSSAAGDVRSRLRMGPLEPRLLFSATPIDPAVLDSADNGATVLEIDVETTQDSQQSSNTVSSQQAATQLIFVDANVQDIEALLDDVQQTRPDAEIFVLQSDRDGIDQITEILDTRSEISSIHLVAHGEDGQVKLGNTWLGESNLDGYAGQIASWQSALTSDADILIYGCDLAANEDGRTLIDSLGALSGADVAASINDTGHTDFQADWEFEYTVGQIDTQAAFSQQLQESWRYKLASLTIDVNTFDDVVNGSDSFTSLREAIIQANANAGGDTTINLIAGEYVRSLNATGEDNAATGDLDIHENVTIVGAGNTIISAGYNDRVFEVHSGHLTISELTITEGVASADGGGIYVADSAAELTLNRVILTDNGAANGAAIASLGTITLTDVEVTNNGGTGSTIQGGGIHNDGTATLNRVTLSSNSADSGGAIYNDSGAISMSLTNVTISGNQASSSGGGIYNRSASLSIVNSTITQNTSGTGGGIRNFGGSLPSLLNTIVAGNTGTSANADLHGDFSSLGNNLIGDGTGQSGFANGTNNDQVGTTGTPVDAQLEALASNGGFVSTHALGIGSLAIDAGATAGATTVDARGVSRDSSRDIGAYESTSSLFWLSTKDNSDSPSGAPGLDSWDNGEVLELSDPNLQLGTGASDGTFSSVFDLEILADDSDLDIDGLHYVSQNITLGTTTTIDLLPGDLLISTRENETFNSGAFSVEEGDVFLFRPDSPGDYSSGTFSHVLRGLSSLADSDINGMGDLWAISLIEQGTVFGDTYLEAGDFLFSRQGGAQDNDVYVFHTENVGDGSTSGTADVLIEGDDIGIDQKIVGLELTETATTMGGILVGGGELLVTLDNSNNSIGTNGISVDRQDVFRLQVSETTLVAGTAIADAMMLLNGPSLELDTNQEDINALAIIPASASAATTTIAYEGFDYAAGSLNGENGGTGWASAWTLNAGGSAQVDATGLASPTGLQPGVGGTLEMNTSSQFNQSRDLSTELGADGTTAWFSFLLKPDGTGLGGISLLIGDSSGPDNTVNIGTAGNDFLVGVDGTASGVKIDNVVADAQTYLLVVQIDFEAGNDTVTLYVDPTPGVSDPDSPGAMTAQLTTADLGTFTSVAVIGGFGGNNSNIDEIRVGRSFHSIAPPASNVAPTDISVSTTAVNENVDTAAGFSLGALTAVDSDAGETFTWQVVGGADVSHFTIGGGSSNELILADGVLDYETQSSYEVTVRVTDSASNTYDETLTINVNDLNDVAPVIDASQTYDVTEGSANSTSLGLVTATDADTVGTMGNWTITSGNTGNAFAINSTTGEITVNETSAIDFESIESYTLGITVGDGVNTSAGRNVTIQINDANDNAPVIASGQSTSILETVANNTSVMTVTASDDDDGASFSSWTIASGNTGNAFVINASTGEITVNDTSAIDFENIQSYTLGITTSDGVNTSASQNVTIQINDANDNTPVVTAGQSASVLETAANSTSVLTVAATDGDAGTSFSAWTIASGNTGNVFAINASTGEITVNDTAAIDFESTSSYTLGIMTSDGANTSATQNVTIQINDANDNTPVVTAGQSASILETAADNTSVMTVAATDGDAGTTFSSWTITSGNTGNAFTINANTGEITVNDTSALNFETTPSYTLGIRTSDGANTSATQTVTIQVNDANDSTPVITAGQSASILETVANNTPVITVAATDGDAGTSFSAWTIASGNTGNAFTINANTGEITVSDTSAIDFESTQSYTLGITVSDGVNTSAAQNVTIQINDANDTIPVIAAGQSGNVSENAADETTVLTVTASDGDAGSTFSSWTIVSGNTGNAFAIDGTTGVIRLLDTSQLDFESTPSYTLGITVSDGVNTSASQNVTIQLVDANDNAPVIGAGQSANVSEDAADGTAVVTVTASDDDAGTTFSSFAIISGNLGDAFEINASTGVIRVQDTSQLNFESVSTYTLGITVSDGANTSASRDVVINLVDANDPATGQPVIQGTPVVGSILEVDLTGVDDEDGIGTPVYQWYRDGLAVTSSTPDKYVLTNDDKGFEIGVTVSFVDAKGNSEGPLSSDPTSTIEDDANALPSFIPPPQAGNSPPPSSSRESAGDESAPTETKESESKSESDTSSDADTSQSDKAVAVRTAGKTDQGSEQTNTANAALPVAVAGQSNEGSNDNESAAQVAASDENANGPSGSTNQSRTLRSSSGNQSDIELDATRIDNEAGALMWEDLVVLTRPGAMWDELDQRQQGVESLIQGDLIVVGSAGAAASSFTVGAVAWAMRSGFLVSGLIAHMPAWSGVDPLMVMQGLTNGGAEGSTETLEELMDRQSKAMETEDVSQGDLS